MRKVKSSVKLFFFFFFDAQDYRVFQFDLCALTIRYCRDIECLARVQPLISRIVYVDFNQRTIKMLIDESKMAVESSKSFLNCLSN